MDPRRTRTRNMHAAVARGEVVGVATSQTTRYQHSSSKSKEHCITFVQALDQLMQLIVNFCYVES